jgi:hypothetical protein
MKKKPFWEHTLPEGHETKHLRKKEVNLAKANARAAGRPYPNLVDNSAVARMHKEK